jgi:membrane protein DedA with SNARE-associated domain
MSEEMDKVWKKFLKKHWKMLALFILIAIIAFVEAVYVFLWFVGEAQVTGLVPSILSGWAMGHIITFLLHLIFWELLYIGIPVLIAIAVIYFGWWKKLPDKEQIEYRDEHLFGKKTHKSNAGGIFSFLIFIAFCIKIYLDGNWSVPIATWKFDYLVNSCITALIWIAIIIGIPVLIGGTLWLFYQMKK